MMAKDQVSFIFDHLVVPDSELHLEDVQKKKPFFW